MTNNNEQSMVWGFTGRPATREQVLAQVGSGWAKIINALIDELWRLGWNGTVMQVKEKFGGLRFYIGTGNDEIFDAIDRAERQSFKVCEDCGRRGKPRNGGWIRTLCNACARKNGYDSEQPR